MDKRQFVKVDKQPQKEKKNELVNNFPEHEQYGRHRRHHGGHHGGHHGDHHGRHHGRHHGWNHHPEGHRSSNNEHPLQSSQPYREYGHYGHHGHHGYHRHHQDRHSYRNKDRADFDHGRRHRGWEHTKAFYNPNQVNPTFDKADSQKQVILGGQINPQKFEQIPPVLEKSSSSSSKQIPQSLLCPISQDLMCEPVMITVCGHTFEQQVIKGWFKKSKMCPLCKKQADESKLQKNFVVASLIENYK